MKKKFLENTPPANPAMAGLLHPYFIGVCPWLKMMPLLVVSILILAGCQKKPAAPATQPAETKKEEAKKAEIGYWTCTMHPQIHAEKPGNCPICGMNLVPVYAAGGGENSPAWMKEEIHLSGEGIHQAGVEIEKAQIRKLARELLIFGALSENQNLHKAVVPLVSGRIERQWIDYNQTEVKKGDPLVSLYSTEAIALQEDYLKALRERWLATFYERKLLDSTVTLAEGKLKRIGFTDEDLARLRRDQKPIMEVTVRSPVTGSIIGNMVQIGEMAKTDVPLYHIVPLDELWFNAQVFEPDLGLLSLGQKVRVTTKSFPGEEFDGTLEYIGRSLDPANRTVPVRFVVPNSKHRLLPNLSASGQLEIPLGDAVLSVPNSAVLDLGTRRVVYMQKEKGVYLARKVRVGSFTPHYTQIMEGLSEGEEVVTSGAFLIDAQSQLRGTGEQDAGEEKGSEEIKQPLESMPGMPSGHHH